MTVILRGTPWLEIDIKGFAQILRNKGIARIALEPISNAFDTEATEIAVFFEQKDGQGLLEVEDNDPNGFADLRDSYLLFAPSNRREDPTKRGRFGQGEKELIAVCSNGGFVTVRSTTGTVKFTKEGRTRTNDKRESGTWLCAGFKCNRAQAAEFEALVRSLIVPEGVKLSFNGQVLQRPTPTKVVRETLPTKIVDDEGNLADTRRLTDIELYEPAEGETSHIYELGVPVVEHDGRWHVNVMQKVPLNTARDNVTPSYLRKLREIMLNETHDLLDIEDMRSAWVRDALPHATDEAIRSQVETVHGKDAVIVDPFNTEASKLAVEQGRNLVHGGAYSGETWGRIKDTGILKPAGQVIQTHVPVSPDGQPPIPRDEWTPEMVKLARYTYKVGEHLLGFQPYVEFHNIAVSTARGKAAAWWGNRTITFNLRWLGKKWPATAEQVDVDDLLLHEFSHHFSSDHTDAKFWTATTSLGAQLRTCKARLR